MDLPVSVHMLGNVVILFFISRIFISALLSLIQISSVISFYKPLVGVMEPENQISSVISFHKPLVGVMEPEIKSVQSSHFALAEKILIFC